MEKRDARLFQQENENCEYSWNIVELESHRHLRQRIDELITFVLHSSLSTCEIEHQLHLSIATFGQKFAIQLVRSLQSDDTEEREAIVWLLTLLNNPETIERLQHMAVNRHIPRSIRLSAALALAGMGATEETRSDYQRRHLYAIV